jgi:2-hydroxycyclohexanecarboxyl-CoA dehydrogenase
VAEIAATPGPAWALESNAVCTEDKPIEDVDDADLDRVIRSEIYGSLKRCTKFAASPSTSRDTGIRPGQSLGSATLIISRLGGEMRALSG